VSDGGRVQSLVNLISVARSGSDLVVGVKVVQGKIYWLKRKINLTDARRQSIAGLADLTAMSNDTEFLTNFGAVSTFTQALSRDLRTLGDEGCAFAQGYGQLLLVVGPAADRRSTIETLGLPSDDPPKGSGAHKSSLTARMSAVGVMRSLSDVGRLVR
jgi:hypothetical protein